MSYQIQWTSRFKKDYKQAIRRGLPIEELDDVIGGADCFLDSFRLPAGSGVCIVLWLIRRG